MHGEQGQCTQFTLARAFGARYRLRIQNNSIIKIATLDNTAEILDDSPATPFGQDRSNVVQVDLIDGNFMAINQISTLVYAVFRTEYNDGRIQFDDLVLRPGISTPVGTDVYAKVLLEGAYSDELETYPLAPGENPSP